MTPAHFDFERLRVLLRRPATDADLVSLIGPDVSVIDRFEHLGSIEFKNAGVSIMFKEAPWILSPAYVSDPKALHVSAFHFHRAGHEGYCEYRARFPKGVAFGDSRAELVRKLGRPSRIGGGGMGTVIKKRIPHWLRYSLDDAILQFQMDAEDRLEMVTLFCPRPNGSVEEN